jgi:hypothetical protein
MRFSRRSKIDIRKTEMRKNLCTMIDGFHVLRCAVSGPFITSLLLAAAFHVCASAQTDGSRIRFGAAVPADVDLIYSRGLSWLASNQKPEGEWNSDSAGEGGPGESGITGMCVMAFLANGEDPNSGPYSKQIRAAVRSIIRSQNPETGFIPGSMYHHGFAMLGLSEVYGALDESTLWTGESDTEKQRSIAKSLELAVQCAVVAQQNNPYGAWRYSPAATDADTSVAGAVMMGLLAARNAGIRIPDEAINKGIDYFRTMTSGRGDVGYSGVPSGGSANLPAIAGIVYAVGKRSELREYSAVRSRNVQNLDHQEQAYPEYFRYYMAQALFQGDFEAWTKWNQRTIRTLKEQQNADGSFSSGHGQAYGTSMSLLALALNYRLLPIYER